MYLMSDEERNFLNGIDYALLNVKEKEVLARKAMEVPEGGTIVELGTARGGATSIFDYFTKGKDVSIHSFDLNECKEAREKFKEAKNISFYQTDTVDGAKIFAQKNSKIDLLFVDAGHMFIDIFLDYNNWVGFLKRGSVIVFHDVDTKLNGGLSFFGIKVFCDALIRSGNLDNAQQWNSILLGNIKDPNHRLTFQNVYNTFYNIAAETKNVIEYYNEKLLEFFLKDEGQLSLDGPDINTLIGSNVKLTRFAFSYILIHWLDTVFNYPAITSKTLETLNKILPHAWNLCAWNNAVTLVDYARGLGRFPKDLEKLKKIKDEYKLSTFITFEESKLQGFWQIAESPFDTIMQKQYDIPNVLDYMRKHKETKQIAIFGAKGQRTKDLISAIISNGHEVTALIDNGFINGSMNSGYVTYTPEVFIHLLSAKCDAIALATVVNKWQMCNQLEAIGYAGNIIF